MENLDVRSSRYHYSNKVGVGGGGGGHGHPRTPPSNVPAVVRENENVLHFIDEQGMFSMGILRETLNSASRTLQC